MNRRTFIQTSVAGTAAAALQTAGRAAPQGQAGLPVVISSSNGMKATAKAMEMLQAGADTLDAVVAGVNIVEEDPNDRSVGYGGLPNENGVVQLDSSVMHGPSRGAGAVACLEGIKTPSKVAKMVMERTDHTLLVGEGAKRFALAMGFEEVDMLTPESREIWMRWKRNLNDRDDWIDPEDRLPESMRSKQSAALREIVRHHGTINCNAVDAAGNISGVTTTSGLAFKIPGRVGDSPIFGAGLYVDNEVGACGSTGRGEANLKTCASFLAVERMRLGDSPEEAGLKALQRIVDNTVEPYLLDDRKRPRFDVNFYVVNKKGECAGVSIWSGGHYVVNDGKESERRDSAYLFERPPRRR